MTQRMPTRGSAFPTTMLLLIAAVGAGVSGPARGGTLEVGPGKQFPRIEDANARAQPGDVILVYPRQAGAPYEKTAVYVRQKGLTFRAVPQPGGRRVKISAKGFNYSGAGSTPRAIFQFNRGTDDCVLEGFELFGAHNDSHNGAGLRINQANRVLVRNCAIHDNDMGIMSNGDGTNETAVDERIEHCEIHHNGDPADPGYNHNLYLGGTSVTLRFCEVHSSLTGHNVKSRAHHTCVQYCYVHHSANREFDLVDAADTARPESHAVLMGNVVVKDPKCPGNKAVLHFGQDGGRQHDGTAYLVFNTIVTPFISPVVELSAPKTKAHLVGNLVSDGGTRQSGQKIAAARGGATLKNLTGESNWFSGDFGSVEGSGLDPATNRFRRAQGPLFVAPAQHDYRLNPPIARSAKSCVPAERLKVPPLPAGQEAAKEPPLAWQYRHPAGSEKRPREDKLTIGAYASYSPEAGGQ